MDRRTRYTLRAALTGAAVMAGAILIAIIVVPIAEVPKPVTTAYECILRPVVDHTERCGGDGVPFLVHEHRNTSVPVTRFELYRRGEWRLTNLVTREAMSGCTDPTKLRELATLAATATWKRTDPAPMCDGRSSGIEAWSVDGVDKLAYNTCDDYQPESHTASLIAAVLDLESALALDDFDRGGCPNTALACYEWFDGGTDSVPPERRFVVQDSGAWQLTIRAAQQRSMTTGTLVAGELAALRDHLDHAKWKLVDQLECDGSSYGIGTVASHGHSVTYGPCSGGRPDPATQPAIDRLFEIYRSVLRANPPSTATR